MILKVGKLWSKFVYNNFIGVLVVAFFITFLAFKAMSGLSISTQIEALMPQGTKSVQTLNNALRKTGSFASIQVVATAENTADAQRFINAAKKEFDQYDWVQSSQYEEDISVLEEHKLLLLSEQELLELEQDINRAFPIFVAKQISTTLGAEVNFTLRDENLTGNSNDTLDENKFKQIDGEVGGNAVTCLLYTSPSPRDQRGSRMPSSA